MLNGTDRTKFKPVVRSDIVTKNMTDSEKTMKNDNQMQTTHDDITTKNEFCLEGLHCDDNQSNNNGKLIKYK